MASTTVSQLGVEVAFSATDATTVSQWGVETANESGAATYLTQFGVEYADVQPTDASIITQWGIELPHTIGASPEESEGAPVGVTRRIRRLRQVPHVSDEQTWLFYSQFQLDLEAGRGLVTGQGIDPQVMLQWSDDGGHTWSSEHWVSAGRLGAYTWRAVWRRLGRSRDRVLRVVISDPIKVTWVDAFLQVQKGTS